VASTPMVEAPFMLRTKAVARQAIFLNQEANLWPMEEGKQDRYSPIEFENFCGKKFIAD